MDDAVDGPDGSTPPTDLADAVLAAARTAPAGRRSRRDSDARRRTRQDNLAGRRDGTGRRRRGGYSAAGPDPDRDPQPIGAVLGGLVGDQGWQRPLAEARVFAEWDRLVGQDIASHATPQTLREGELRIAAESTAWATQLRLLSATLLARLVAELGPDVVTKLTVTGPVGPSWKHGARTVRGHRGPRDTYG